MKRETAGQQQQQQRQQVVRVEVRLLRRRTPHPRLAGVSARMAV